VDALALVFWTKMSIISSLKNSLKKSSGAGFVSAKLSSKHSWKGRIGLFRGRAVKLGLCGTNALFLISACKN
jgi:hypothetical protein